MKVMQTALPGVLLLEPLLHKDDRGFFMETSRESHLQSAGITSAFVQENQSRSVRGTLRGLHYQATNPQGKLVRVVRGCVYDVVVDIRRGSPHFGQWLGMQLDDVAHQQLWIPPGFAHGFYVLSEQADLVYKCTTYYDAALDTGIAWNDPAIAVAWPECPAGRLLSARDQQWRNLAQQPQENLPLFGVSA